MEIKKFYMLNPKIEQYVGADLAHLYQLHISCAISNLYSTNRQSFNVTPRTPQ